MSRLYYPNLLFEEELSGREPSVAAAARRRAAELASVMGLLTSPDANHSDVILSADDAIPANVPSALEHIRFFTLQSIRELDLAGCSFQPWGWSPQAVQVGRSLQLEFAAPGIEIVGCVNGRSFFAEFDECIFLGQPERRERFGESCASIEEVTAALTGFRNRGFSAWVIKSEISHAARNRITGTQLLPNESQCKWLCKRFTAGERVYVEPWVERIAECGLQFSIPGPRIAPEAIKFDGAAEMITNAAGQYFGSLIGSPTSGEWWYLAIDHCRQIARRAAAAGYFGPVGMDCMLLRHPTDSRPWLRLCHDINGRHTMGRIALSLRRLLTGQDSGLWLHTLTNFDAVNLPQTGNFLTKLQFFFESAIGKHVKVVPTSPAINGSEPAKLQTALVISDDYEALKQGARRFLAQNTRRPTS